MSTTVAQSQDNVTKTLTQIDRSTRGLNAAAENVRKAVSEAIGIELTVAKLAEDLEFKQNELDNLNKDFELRRRDFQADLQIRVKEDENGVLNSLLEARESVAIKKVDLRTLQSELNAAKADNTAAINAAVKVATDACEQASTMALERQQAAHAVQTATLEAAKTSLEERNHFLTHQIAALQKQIDDERQARVEIAKASTPIIQQIPASTGK